jgi:hypothetical protein
MYGSDHRGNPVHAGKVTNDFFKRTHQTNREMAGNYRDTPRIEAMSGMTQDEINMYRARRDFLKTTDPRTAELLSGEDEPSTEVETSGLMTMHDDLGDDFEGYGDSKEELNYAIETRHEPEFYESSADGKMAYPRGSKIDTGFYPGSPREGQIDPRTTEQRYKAMTPVPTSKVDSHRY